MTEVKAQLQHRAHHDELTGLANRAFFREQVWRALRETRRTDRRMVVMFIDIDDFKVINDNLGHFAGDNVLTAIARRLRAHGEPGGTIARLGGDEFGILAKGLSSREAAEHAAQQILASISAPLRVEGEDLTVQASVGIAFGTYGASAGEVLQNADLAMYAAKKRGKSRIELFQPDLQTDVRADFRLRYELDAAVQNQEFRLAFQPIVELQRGRLTGFEALLRWRHPHQGLPLPDSFYRSPRREVASTKSVTGCFGKPCNMPRSGAGFSGKREDFSISVNISASELERPHLAEDVGDALAKIEFDPRMLILEITETTLMQAPVQRLYELRQLGMQLAIDDFGTGYSSLAALYKMPADILKIDRLFIEGIDSDRFLEDDAGPFVETIVGLGQVLGLTIIAEGIETRSQLARVRALGCTMGQGFYFAEPLTPSEATHLVEAHVAGHTHFDGAGEAHARPSQHLRAVP